MYGPTKTNNVTNDLRQSQLPVLSGVPQGSVIDSALFLLYINDLPDYVKSDVHLFYRTRNRLKKNCHQLKEDLQNLKKWES